MTTRKSSPPKAAKPTGLSAPGVVVIGPKRGRWRAGRQFGAEPVSIPLEDLSEADMDALSSDPALTVTEMQMPPEQAKS